MAKRSNGRYSKEFRNEAVKMVIEGDLTAYEVSRQLSLPKSTLENWVRAHKAGKLGDISSEQRPLSELSQVKQERDILKKAAAYFAKESLPGTR